MINLRNKNQRDALSFQIYSNNILYMFRTDKLFILRRQLLTRSSWRSTLIVLAASQRGCTINTVDCMYSKLPTEDEQFICSKHVEDIIGINLKRTCISFVSYYANVPIMLTANPVCAMKNI